MRETIQGEPRKDFGNTKKQLTDSIGQVLDMMDDASGDSQDIVLAGAINPNSPVAMEVQLIDVVEEPKAKKFLNFLQKPMENSLSDYAALLGQDPVSFLYPKVYLLDETGDDLLSNGDWIARIPDLHGIAISLTRMRTAVDKCSNTPELSELSDKVSDEYFTYLWSANRAHYFQDEKTFLFGSKTVIVNNRHPFYQEGDRRQDWYSSEGTEVLALVRPSRSATELSEELGQIRPEIHKEGYEVIVDQTIEYIATWLKSLGEQPRHKEFLKIYSGVLETSQARYKYYGSPKVNFDRYTFVPPCFLKDKDFPNKGMLTPYDTVNKIVYPILCNTEPLHEDSIILNILTMATVIDSTSLNIYKQTITQPVSIREAIRQNKPTSGEFLIRLDSILNEVDINKKNRKLKKLSQDMNDVATAKIKLLFRP